MADTANRSWWKRLLFFLLRWGVILGIVGGIIVALYGLVLIPFTPSTSEIKDFYNHRSSVVRSADGEVLAQLGRRGRRWVSLEEVSDHVVDALIATEDRKFYDHDGIDYKRTVAAVVYTLLGDRQGGSTITQQLARNMYPQTIGRQDPLTRKLMEMITARKVESAYNKKEILELYLNTVPFLYNAFGIEMAAETYFDKPAAELSLTESATLVGMLKGPSYYNPVMHPDRSRRRRNVVLYQMVKTGALGRSRYDEIKDAPVQTDFRSQLLRDSVAPHFAQYVRKKASRWAEEHGYSLVTDGLTIHTTINAGLQRMARESVQEWGLALQQVADVEWSRPSAQLLATDTDVYERRHDSVEPFAAFWETHQDLLARFVRETRRYQQGLDRDIPPGHLLDSLRQRTSFMDSLKSAKTRLEVGFTAIEPNTGHVKAWVGSRDFLRDQYDHVATARRQPGSTFKPFVYAAALENGYMPGDSLPDKSITITDANGDEWRPVNASGISGKNVTLRTALTESKNTVTARLTRELGPSKVVTMARRLGVNESDLKSVPSVGLGTSEVTLLEMVSAYASIANAGVHRQPLAITHIADSTGKVVAEFSSEAGRAMSEKSARMLIDMMRGVVDSGTGQGVRTRFGLRGDLIGKTGTTQHGADGWFIMAHPDLTAGSWVGFNDPRIRFRTNFWGQGARTGLYVVSDFFQQAVGGRLLASNARFPEPPPGMEADDEPALAERVGNWIGSVANRIGSVFSGGGSDEDEPTGSPESGGSANTSPQPQDQSGSGADAEENNSSESSGSDNDRRRGW